MPRGIDVEPLHLPRVAQPEERVAAAQRVLHEGEGALALEGHEPEREPGHLHGHGVLIYAEETAIRNQPAGKGQALVDPCEQESSHR